MNQNLIHFIEENGGEVVVTSFSSYVKMIEKPYLPKWFREKLYLNVISYKTLIAAVKQLEKSYQKFFDCILLNSEPNMMIQLKRLCRQITECGLRIPGSPLRTRWRCFYQKQYSDTSLLVQTNPAFSCSSLVTIDMASEIERITGVPIVSTTYDGMVGHKNKTL